MDAANREVFKKSKLLKSVKNCMFGAVQSWRGLAKIANPLDFRSRNPGSEPETVPDL